MYKGKKCVGMLNGITDALEWSFVAVPAQRNAGVVKEYNENKEGIEMDVNQIAMKACASLSTEESTVLLKALKSMSDDEKSTEIKALQTKLKAFEEENEKLKSDIKNKAMDEAKSKLYEGLTPVNEKAKAMADGLVDGLLVIGEDGEVGGIDEARALLENDYPFLFSHEEPDGNEPKVEEVEEKEMDETNEVEDEAEKSFKPTAKFSMGVKTSKQVSNTKTYTPGFSFGGK